MCLLTETRALSAQGEKRALVGNLTMPCRRNRVIARRMFMSSGIGCAMISLKNFSPSSILLSHNEGAFGWRALHQKSVRSAISELTLVFRCAPL